METEKLFVVDFVMRCAGQVTVLAYSAGEAEEYVRDSVDPLRLFDCCYESDIGVDVNAVKEAYDQTPDGDGAEPGDGREVK